MKRRVTTQDISWFLDLERNAQLDLNPSYQRRSVWTLKDRRFFLDTIFRGYPCPAIFLHKTTAENGQQIYHVVDGKQRLETIISFAHDDIAIDKEFGDKQLAGKKWKGLDGYPDLKKVFWDYVLSVEMLDTVEGLVVNEVFDRLNRNSRKLERQELRHAKFDGWLISAAESESEKEEWKNLGIVTAARSKRMRDVQFISELLLVLLDNKIVGFDQDYLDERYAFYDSLREEESAVSEEQFLAKLAVVKEYILGMEKYESCVTTHAKGFGNFYTLWSAIALNDQCPAAATAAAQYAKFMMMVEKLAAQKDPESFISEQGRESFKEPFHYFRNTLGASTDLSQRDERHRVVSRFLRVK